MGIALGIAVLPKTIVIMPCATAIIKPAVGAEIFVFTGSYGQIIGNFGEMAFPAFFGILGNNITYFFIDSFVFLATNTVSKVTILQLFGFLKCSFYFFLYFLAAFAVGDGRCGKGEDDKQGFGVHGLSFGCGNVPDCMRDALW